MKILHLRDEVKQMGRNQILASRVQAGVTVALLGAVIVYMVFSKFR
jgi:hypothetical protein